MPTGRLISKAIGRRRPFRRTPNSIARYLLKKWNLDATRDVTLVESANSASCPL